MLDNDPREGLSIITTLPPAVKPFQDVTFSNNTTFYYRVTAIGSRSGQQSIPSRQIKFATNDTLQFVENFKKDLFSPYQWESVSNKGKIGSDFTWHLGNPETPINKSILG